MSRFIFEQRGGTLPNVPLLDASQGYPLPMRKRVMTRVSGYYNGEKWPIQSVVPKRNLTLTLEPGDFIRDSNGQKINDSFFEPFANSGNLSRELADAPVPVDGLDKCWPMDVIST